MTSYHAPSDLQVFARLCVPRDQIDKEHET